MPNHRQTAKTSRGGNKEGKISRRCFVLMPFSPEFDALYENAIRPAVHGTRLLRCLRADEIYGPRPIMADIWASINDAFVLIADVTGRNPNVLYELGLAHAVHKPVVLMTQAISDVPFDLRAIRCIVYSNDRAGRAQLSDQLAGTLAEMLRHVRRNISALSAYAVLPHHPPVPQKPSAATIVTDAADPWSVISSIRRRSGELEKGKDRQPQPAELEMVLSLLDGYPTEVVLEALAFLKEHIDDARLPLLYRHLDSKNAAVRRAALQVIGDHPDETAERLLIDKLTAEGQSENDRAEIVEALTKIGSELTFARCMATIESEGLPASRGMDAFRILCHSPMDGARLKFLSRLSIPGAEDRLRLLNAICDCDDGDFRFSSEFRMATRDMLEQLSTDPDPEIRGRMAFLWLRLAHRRCGATVSPDPGWAVLESRSRPVWESFFDAVGDAFNYDRLPLSAEDGQRLVEMARGDEILEDDIVYWVDYLDTRGVDEFMVAHTGPEDDNRLWALAYFAKFPSPLAAEVCRKELVAGGDLSERVLAAICLGRLKDPGAIAFVLENVKGAHEWVGVLARPLLEEIKKHDPRRRRTAQALLKRLPTKTWSRTGTSED
jgi:hypothetical protein